MQLKLIVRALAALASAGLASSAGASGFQLLEQNASGLGNAYAGSAAVADNASTIFYNPAGMTELKDQEVSLGVNAIKPSYTFTNSGSSTGTLHGDGGDAGSLAAVPNLYGSLKLTDRLYAGIGISVPFGLKTEYDNPWMGGAQSLLFELKTVNVNPSVAFKVNDKVSLGFGLNYQKLEATYERLAAVANGPVLGLGSTVRPTSTTTATLEADSSAWGWNAGGLFKLSDTMKVGVSYRSEIKHKLEGTLTADGSDALLNLAASSDAKAEVTLPATAIISVSQQLGDRWEALGDLSWTGWSSIPKVDIVRTSGAQSGATAQTLETSFRDTWRVALGANYKLNDVWKLKYGVAYDQSPVKGASTRLVSLPDNDRVWLSVGAQWRPNQVSTIDLGLAYLYVRDAKIDNNQSAAGRGRVTGEYSGNIWVLGAQYSARF